MPVKKSDYEEGLAEYSNRECAIALLKQHRPYLELLPSMRRPQESIIPIPLPIVRIRHSTVKTGSSRRVTNGVEALALPCDLAFLMCDPEWKIKMGVEILVFIHRPDEDLSDLLSRWRETQVSLESNYEWLMPLPYQHIFSEGADRVYPLFIVFAETPERIKKGLTGACLPFIVQTPLELVEPENSPTYSSNNLP